LHNIALYYAIEKGYVNIVM